MELVSTGRVLDDETLEGVLQLLGGSMVGQIYRLNTMLRVREAKKNGRLNGKLTNPSLSLYGYTYLQRDRENGTPGKYIKNPDEASVVAEIARRYIDGRNISAIVRWLNDSGVPAPQSPNTPKMSRRENPRWTRGKVRAILGHPAYGGRFYQGKRVRGPRRQNGNNPIQGLTRVIQQSKQVWHERPRAEWEHFVPLDDPVYPWETYLLIQELLGPDEHQPRGPVKTEHALQGKVKCGVCGSVYWIKSPGNGRVKTFYCSSGHGDNKPPRCGNRQIATGRLERLIWDNLLEYFKDPKEVARRYKQKAQAAKPRRTITKEIKALESQLEDNARAFTGVEQKYAYGKIDDAAYERRRAMLEGDRQRWSAELDALRQEEASQRVMREMPNKLAEITDREAQQEWMSRRIHEVIIRPKEITAHGFVIEGDVDMGLGRWPLNSGKGWRKYREMSEEGFSLDPGEESGVCGESLHRAR